MEKTKRYILPEDRIPRRWYNIQADMPTKPLPPLNPATRKPMNADDLSHIFSKECSRQELDVEHAWIDIPEEVQDKYHLCHICIESRNYPDQTSRKETFDKVLGGENVIISSVEDLQNKIVDIVTTYASKNDHMIVETAVPSIEKVKTNENGEITW